MAYRWHSQTSKTWFCWCTASMWSSSADAGPFEFCRVWMLFLVYNVGSLKPFNSLTNPPSKSTVFWLMSDCYGFPVKKYIWRYTVLGCIKTYKVSLTEFLVSSWKVEECNITECWFLDSTLRPLWGMAGQIGCRSAAGPRGRWLRVKSIEIVDNN